MKRIIVCIKPVPDPREWNRLKMNPETKTLVREGIGNILNPLDKHAVESALRIKNKLGAEVVLLSMAPPSAKPLLREALAMGADQAFLVSDPVFAGSDTLATARILAAGVRCIGDFDVILCGEFSLDGSTAQVPSQVAELLGIPNVCHVSAISIEQKDAFFLTQKIEHGFARIAAKPPILLAVTKEVNKPRFISFLEILAAENRPITILDNGRLGLSPETIGLGGSPTKMADLILRRQQRDGVRLSGSMEEMAQQLTDRLVQAGIL